MARKRITLRQALQANDEALHTWLHTYAPEHCAEAEVQRYRSLIAGQGGTLAYLAKMFALNKSVLRRWRG